MNPRNPAAFVLDDPVLARLVAALCQACEEFLKIERGVFAVSMMVNPAGEIGVFHVSVMDSLEWFQLQVDIDAELDSGLAAGQFQAVGNCFNIAYQDIHDPGDIPVLAIRVQRVPGQPVHVRVHYQPCPDGTIQFGAATVVPAQEGMPN
jgi:hypothetical protein